MPDGTGTREDQDRLRDERAAFHMTEAVRVIGTAAALVRSTGRQANLRNLEILALGAKRVRDQMYVEQGPIQHVS